MSEQMSDENGRPELVEVRVSVPDEEVGRELAELLLSERLAACVQILGEMTSTYVWQGHVERENERLILAKTTAARFPQLCARLEEAHPYDTPEILAVPVVGASEPYAVWVAESV